MGSDGELRTEHRVEDSVLVVEAYVEAKYSGFDGEETTREVLKRRIVIEADEEMARLMGGELRAWAAEQSNTSGPPGEIPMHQRYANMEPDP